NHQYCAARAAQVLRRDLSSLKLVTCHLGNGCSLAAIQEGHSIDTTMGFTPSEGLMMGTRSGSVDPGILTYLMRQGRLQAEEIDAACKQLSFLDLKLDDAANAQHPTDGDIAAPNSSVRVLIIRAQEDWAIAKECWHLMRAPEADDWRCLTLSGKQQTRTL